jgi:hypothetical protein
MDPVHPTSNKESAAMIPADLVQLAVALVPAALFVAIFGTAVAVVASVAVPGGLVDRTMDPAETWR